MDGLAKIKTDIRRLKHRTLLVLLGSVVIGVLWLILSLSQRDAVLSVAASAYLSYVAYRLVRLTE